MWLYLVLSCKKVLLDEEIFIVVLGGKWPGRRQHRFYKENTEQIITHRPHSLQLWCTKACDFVSKKLCKNIIFIYKCNSIQKYNICTFVLIHQAVFFLSLRHIQQSSVHYESFLPTVPLSCGICCVSCPFVSSLVNSHFLVPVCSNSTV